MELFDLHWWFLDGDKSSNQIIAAKHQQRPQKQVQQTVESSKIAEVDDIESDEML